MSHYLIMMSGQGCPADIVCYFKHLCYVKMFGIVTSICCLVTFPLLHCWHYLHQLLMSLFMDFQTSLLEMRQRVAHAPGWAMWCRAEKTPRRWSGGMTGLATPVEMSHKMCGPPKGKALCCRPEDCCKAEISGPPNSATLLPASVDLKGQDWIPLKGDRPFGVGRCRRTSAVPR